MQSYPDQKAELPSAYLIWRQLVVIAHPHPAYAGSSSEMQVHNKMVQPPLLQGAAHFVAQALYQPVKIKPLVPQFWLLMGLLRFHISSEQN